MKKVDLMGISRVGVTSIGDAKKSKLLASKNRREKEYIRVNDVKNSSGSCTESSKKKKEREREKSKKDPEL